MSNDTTLVDRIIRDAYAIAGKPERLLSLLEQSDAQLRANRDDVVAADLHFDEAGNLIDELTPLINSDFSGFDTHQDAVNDASGEKSELVVDGDFRIVAFDDEVFGGGAIRPDEYLPEWVWDRIDSKDDMRRLRAADAGKMAGFLRLYTSAEDAQGRWFAVEVAGRGADRRIRFKLIQFRWHEGSGDQFAKALGLTQTELALTRHLVSGGTVRSFAEERGRSIGTARNQLKALQRKLAIGSQQELLMLYTGFAHSLRLMDDDASPRRHYCSRIYRESEEDRIAWEQHGDPDGDPVLYFHPFFEGALFTAQQDGAARAAGLKIIAPWRPMSGETTGSGVRLDLVRNFARRLGPFLDAQGVGRCAILGATAGGPFALGFSQMHPDRVSGAVLAGSVIPWPKWSDLRTVRAGYRRPLQLTRMAPAFARIYIRATLAGSLKGGFDTYIDDFYSGSPLDAQFYKRPEIRETIRLSGTYTFVRTLDGPAEGVILEASDWSDLCVGQKPPVTVMAGIGGGVVGIENYERFADRYGFDFDPGFERSGQLVMHDDPERVFARLRAMIDAG